MIVHNYSCTRFGRVQAELEFLAARVNELAALYGEQKMERRRLLSAIKEHRKNTEARLALIAGGSIKKDQINATDKALWDLAGEVERG